MASPSSPAGLLIPLDPQAGPLHQQVYEGIRRAILDRVIAPGARLPSSRALAAHLEVSRTTTFLAYEQLVAEGYVTGRRGAGTFVALDIPDDVQRAARPTPIASRLRHPPLSMRGRALAGGLPHATRVSGPPRPFRIGTPAIDLFPLRTWARSISRRLSSASLAQLDYGAPAGFAPLREAIAARVNSVRGARCTADQVIIVAGAQRGMAAMCHLLLDVGDTAWLEDPGYPGARSALTAAGAQIVPVPVDAHGLQVEAGERAAPRARLAYVTPSHQFPLGIPMTMARRSALLQWAARAGAWVVEDDYDSEFRFDERPVPCLHGLDGDGRVIYVGSFSKTLFPALRLGFLVVPSDLVDAVVGYRRTAEVCLPSIDQAALADFVGEGHYDRHLRRMQAAYRERLEAMVEAARRCAAGALRLRPVRTGLHAVAELDGANAVEVAALAAERRIETMPVAAYALDTAHAPNALVLGFGAAPAHAVHDAMRSLVSVIEAARSGRPRARPVPPR